MGYDAVDTCTDHLPTEEEINEVLSLSADCSYGDSCCCYLDLSSSCMQGGFFPVMSHYFEVNARWSTKPNVPGLGDENTAWAEVIVDSCMM